MSCILSSLFPPFFPKLFKAVVTFPGRKYARREYTSFRVTKIKYNKFDIFSGLLKIQEVQKIFLGLFGAWPQYGGIIQDLWTVMETA